MRALGWPALGVVLAFLATACATQTASPPPAEPPRAEAPRPEPPALTDLYVLLPSQEGPPGALVVTHGGQERTLAGPYEAIRIERAGTMQAVTVTPERAREEFAAALSAQPPRPAAFVLHFLPGSDDFTPESKLIVEDVFREIARRPAPDVLVIGHTDTVGADDFNDRLSLQRAERVRAALIGRGIAADRVQAIGRGERELLVPTADQVPELRNRRVEIVVR